VARRFQDHPLAIGSVISVLDARTDGLFIDGIATIICPVEDPDHYLVLLSATGHIKRLLIFPDGQPDPGRFTEIVNRLLANARRLSNAPEPGTSGERP